MTTLILAEGIVHLEDLDLQSFIKVVGNMAKLQASEKLDGAQLWFGIDDEGKLFTSRAGKRKNAENMYQEKDYPYFSAYNGFRAAHAALKAKEADLKRILTPGSTVEIEVLYGRQPNAVTYGAGGKNYIAFLRGVEGTADATVDQLTNIMTGTSVQVKVQTVDTTDGVNLKLTPTDITFQFVGAQKIDTANLKTTDVSKQLAKLQDYLRQRADLPGKIITNFDLAVASLGSIDKDIRPTAKQLKAQVLAHIMTDFKLPIKKELLDKFVSKIKSPLAADDLSSDEDIGIEGVVLRDPDNGDQIKLVDKDTFTTVNQFNHSIRGAISGTIKTLDPAASVEARGGMLGLLKITIADLIGNIELARTQSAKKVFQIVKGKDPEETVRNVAKELGGEDYRATKTKIAALIDNTQQQLDQALKDFKANKDQFSLKLKSGKTMGLSAEVIRRTLVAFAEAKRDVTELGEKVKKTKSLVQLVALLYGKVAKAVHEVEEAEQVTEELLSEKRIVTDISQYKGKDAWTLLNTYFATYMMASVIYQTDDAAGIKILRDQTNMRLTRWDKDMSPLNFWGYIVWRSGTPAVKKIVGPKIARELFKHARHVPDNFWRFLHMDLSYGKIRKVEWIDHRKAISILQRTPGMVSDRINTLLADTFRYVEMTFDEKVKFHTKLFYYIQQFVPNSPLAYRLRVIYNNLLLNANGENDQMVQEMKLLQQVTAITEDGDAAATMAAAAGGPGGASPIGPATATSTTAGSIANYQTSVFGKQRKTVMMRRNPDIVRNKFPRPKDGDKK